MKGTIHLPESRTVSPAESRASVIGHKACSKPPGSFATRPGPAKTICARPGYWQHQGPNMKAETAGPRYNSILLGILGAGVGGLLGYFAFGWLARQGLYGEPPLLAARLLAGNSPGPPRQPPALAPEAWLGLGADAQPKGKTRALFFGAPAEPMRGIRVEHSRRRRRAKRGGGVEPLD